MRLILSLLLTCASLRAAEPLQDVGGNPLPPGAVARLGAGAFHLAECRPETGRIEFSPDGQRLVVQGKERIHVRNATTGQPIREFDCGRFDLSGCSPVSPNGKVIAGTHAGTDVRGWDADTGLLLFSHENVATGKGDFSVGFLADGTPVYCRSREDFAQVFDALTGKELRHFAARKGSKWVRTEPLPGGKYFLVVHYASREKDRELIVSAEVLDAATFKPRRTAEGLLRGERGSVRCSADGGTLLLVGDGKYGFWDAASGESFGERNGSRLAPPTIALSADGTVAAVSEIGEGFGKEHDSFELVDVRRNRTVRTFGVADCREGTVALSLDGKRVAFWSGHRVQVWDAITGKELTGDPGHRRSPNAMAYSPDGSLIASASDGELFLWRVRDGKLLHHIGADAKRTPLEFLRFSPDGIHLLSATRAEVTLRRVGDGKPVGSRKRAIRAMQFHPDGKRVCLADENTIEECEFPSLKPTRSRKHRVPEVTELHFTPSEKQIVIAGPRQLDLLDLSDGKIVRSFANSTDPPSGVGSGGLASGPFDRFSPSRDGDWAQAISTNGLWHSLQLSTGNRLKSDLGRSLFDHHHLTACGSRVCAAVILRLVPEFGRDLLLIDRATGQVRYRRPFSDQRLDLIASPDGRYLASASEDTTILVWDLWNLPDDFPIPEKITEETVREQWDLLESDPRELDGRIRLLCQRPDLTVAMLKEKLAPVEKPDLGRIERFVGDLGSDRFSVRERASKEIEKYGEFAVPILRRRREQAGDEDLQARLSKVLSRLDSPFLSGESLRAYRGIEILERLDTPEAKELLKKLAKGEPEAALTREAKAALKE